MCPSTVSNDNNLKVLHNEEFVTYLKTAVIFVRNVRVKTMSCSVSRNVYKLKLYPTITYYGTKMLSEAGPPS